MAISQMKKLSILLEKEKLDPFLQLLQKTQLIEIRDISQLDHWQEAFSKESVSLPKIYQFDEEGQEELEGDRALNYLKGRQEELERAIKELETFLPKEGKWASLKKGKLSVYFEDLEKWDRQSQANHLFASFKQKRDRLEELNKEIEKLQSELEELRKWEKLEVLPEELAQFEAINAQVGTIPSTEDDRYYRQLLADPRVEVESIFHRELEYGLILFWNKKDPISLEDYQFKALSYRYQTLPAEMIKEKEQFLTDYQAEKTFLIGELAQSKEELEQMQIQIEYYLDLSSRQASKKYLASTQHLVALEAWIEAEEEKQLKEIVEKTFAKAVFIESEDVDQADWEEVPIKLRNHSLIEPFELVTEMYALPKYYEKDPTPILAPFYFTFFGMMVADLGYGLILFLATKLAMTVLKLDQKKKRFMKFFNILGVAVSLWGIVYGSFFGFNLPFLILSTRTDVMTILLLSVFFGFVTVIVGLLLGGLQEVKMKDYAQAYSSGFAWCLILIGILLLALGMNMPSLAALASIGKWLAIVNAVGIVLVAIVKAKSLKGLGIGLYNLYNISAYVGDLVSFTRLMALGLSGASIGSAFNLIVGIFPPLGRFSIGILIFILLHAINIFLSLLSGYVHGARLMFVEFFGKFYQGGGKAFQPLKSAEKYVFIKKEK
ncbi:V-type ATP synthase subunit I [Streptococcus catagoni]|uniref:V-type ATP synthase subunit I n=1 Tax=Streptococcus catagoni TaxID=2654874 RepID=UPI00140C0CA8|nr:V-type ATP synthase subunit I [Streptococcus catagoni]